jgi:hypothetical protein
MLALADASFTFHCGNGKKIANLKENMHVKRCPSCMSKEKSFSLERS